jgi:F-type H+-transporting ATPase subunit b
MHLDGWTIVLQIVNFCILAWILHRLLYKPVLAVIDARKALAAKQLDSAKAIEAQAQAKLAQIESDRAGIAAEREAALKAAADEARDMAASVRAQAERDAQALVDATHKSLATEREQALAEARRLALDLGASFAQKLLAEIPASYRSQTWLDRVEAHLAALSPSEKQALLASSGGTTPVTVVTAGELPPETAELWKARLHAILDQVGDVKFEVDPDLIGGVELHFPTAILRFSWRSVLEAARAEAGSHA